MVCVDEGSSSVRLLCVVDRRVTMRDEMAELDRAM
jgi:hypothetical protein